MHKGPRSRSSPSVLWSERCVVGLRRVDYTGGIWSNRATEQDLPSDLMR